MADKKTGKAQLIILIISLIILFLFFMVRKSMETAPWPEGTLYDHIDLEVSPDLAGTREEIMEQISGHYAHYDIVSYEDVTTRAPMRTFIISYGFTDIFVEDGKLYLSNRFIHAEQVLNQKNTTSYISDLAVQSMEDSMSEVRLEFVDGVWKLFRPATPVLMGIKGDPYLPLSKDPDDAALTDPDHDGFPGVSVHLNISGFLKGEIYIARREIFEYDLQVYSEDLIAGNVKDFSEQLVLGASRSFLNRPSNNIQHPDPAMNPIILKRIPESIDTWEELEPIRDELFPPPPSFY
ncbi:hypothetical protein [Spirochaeta isovalerica]|uniref:Uncharacterized protein n=1 Tax=Spirochaeta isovalerica TaxID=150 RepID=A0A841R9P5_9SPIO|nr:hypothetical protein [Spirochaeta isovalerica]MBB6479428.1 hypothetical protein [Spirochaeta isovalerica]